jgi:hypothetical protein
MIHGNFSLRLFANDRELELTSETVSISCQSSIYSQWNKANIKFNDPTGLILESFAIEKGMPIRLEYGNEDKKLYNDCNYVIENVKVPETNSSDSITGPVEIELTNPWKYQQVQRSFSYKKRISEIVNNLTRGNFNSVNISDTGNQDVWIQGLKTDSDFIFETLLPYAYSRNASNTPFFCFIDNNNTFHFRHFKSLIQPNPIETYKYEDDTNILGESSQTTVKQIKKLDEGLKDIYPFLHYKEFVIDEDGNLAIEQEGKFKELSHEPLGKILVRNEINTEDNYVYFDKFKRGDQSENDKGSFINKLKDHYFTDRLLCLVPFNVENDTGKSFNLEVNSQNNGQLSARFSGKYVIEMANHVYDSDQLNAFSMLLLARRGTNTAPSDYNLREGVI